MTILLLLALAAGSLSEGGQQAPPADISGTWELSVTTSRGPEVAMLTLKKSGDTFSGAATRGSSCSQMIGAPGGASGGAARASVSCSAPGPG